ncbi:hypothetical protein PC123_g24736 [Phytophthora cactorum]|nr:hypothetical protein PC123_g24736 [Phytophthora cactorum]
MVKLFCAIDGVAESAFPVNIDAGQLLFLAKKEKGAGAWLTEKEVKEGVNDTNGLELLDVEGAPLNLVGLSEDDVRFRVTKENVKAKTVPVHVLVVVPPEEKTSSPYAYNGFENSKAEEAIGEEIQM